MLRIIVILAVLAILGCQSPTAPPPLEDLNETFWANHPGLVQKTTQAIKDEKVKIVNLDSVRMFMWRFQYVPEVKPFIPTIKTVFARDFCGDCQTAAVMGEWALECIGIPADLVLLGGNGVMHMIALANNHRVFVSNNSVITLPQSNWENSLYSYFSYRYNRMR